MESLLRQLKKIIPYQVFTFFQPAYHFILAAIGAFIYDFPSRQIKVIAVTGTKGKSSTTELISAILEEAGFKTALAGTVRFKIGVESQPNMYKMTIPGRFFVQKFLRDAVKDKCDYAILEMTSEGAKQFRHKFIDFDALVFTNLSPEHIESHGSYENYVKAKLSIAEAVAESRKKNTAIIANADEKEGAKFLAVNIPQKFPYSLAQAEPYTLSENGSVFTFEGQTITTSMLGKFNIYNMLAAATLAKSQGISADVIKKAFEAFAGILGRVQKITLPQENPLHSKQNFGVVVDYAHTPDSLEKIYDVFKGSPKICVLGNTGGGRDTWKRPVMGEIADKYCEYIILTNEDPYDEDPRKIVEDVKKGIKLTPTEIIMDRRQAIRKAIELASAETSKPTISDQKPMVVITGKGTDPYLMEADGKKTPWSDAAVATEELIGFLSKNQ